MPADTAITKIQEPQWHDRPTVPGDWMFVDKKGRKWLIEILNDLSIITRRKSYKSQGRWYGPIPPDTTARPDAGHN